MHGGANSQGLAFRRSQALPSQRRSFFRRSVFGLIRKADPSPSEAMPNSSCRGGHHGPTCRLRDRLSRARERSRGERALHRQAAHRRRVRRSSQPSAVSTSPAPAPETTTSDMQRRVSARARGSRRRSSGDATTQSRNGRRTASRQASSRRAAHRSRCALREAARRDREDGGALGVREAGEARFGVGFGDHERALVTAERFAEPALREGDERGAARRV